MAVRSSIKNPHWDPLDLYLIPASPGIPELNLGPLPPNPLKPGPTPVYSCGPGEPTGPPPTLRCDDEESLYLRPIGFRPICYHEWVDLHLIPGDPPSVYSELILGPGGEGLIKEDDWLRCAPTFPACKDWDY